MTKLCLILLDSNSLIEDSYTTKKQKTKIIYTIIIYYLYLYILFSSSEFPTLSSLFKTLYETFFPIVIGDKTNKRIIISQ